MSEDLTKILNTEQIEAVTTTEGFVRVIAGAGSGKTRALSHRFAYLVNEIGILPSHILCVTFTNKAANEMRSRIRKLTGDNDTGYISTFHGFCVSVLQEESYAVQYPKSFLVLDNSDIDAMLSIIYEERNLTLRQMTFSHARDMIEIRKTIKEPEYYNYVITMSLEQIKQKYLESTQADDIIFYGYLYQQKKCFGLDYNDLIKFTLYIFKESEQIRLKWQQRLEYIMIDEFQDIDKLQYTLMEVLCDYHKNLFIVGDPDQTVYSWRGADVRFLLNFDKNFHDVKTIMMMKNYRSTPQIIHCSNSLISKNKMRIEKNLVPTLSDGQNVIYHHAKTADDEALWIAQKIKSLVEKEVKLSEIAILFRAHYISRSIEDMFQQQEIPYTLFSGLPFFEREEIKDSLSYLRMIAYKDDLSFIRVVNTPKRNIGERRMNFLKEYAEKKQIPLYTALKQCLEDDLFKNTQASQFIELVEHFNGIYHKMPISELLSAVVDRSGYEKILRTEGCQERLDNLAELKQSIYEYETTCGEEAMLENYLSHVALFTSADVGSVKNAVRLMTVHSAKGLEFPYVFLCGLNENMFPSKRTINETAMEEERRLAFVAFTRAQKGLFLTEAEGVKLGFGFRFPSRFIFDVEKKFLSYTNELDESLVTNAIRYIHQSEESLKNSPALSSLQKGTRVVHGVLGAGVILEVDENHKSFLIKFDKVLTPRKLSFRAPLKNE